MKKNISYEALRFLFFLFVFFYHCKSVFSDIVWLAPFSHAGILAVSSFFVLSGIVTGLSYAKHKRESFSSFSKYFAKKIKGFYPAHIIFMLFAILLEWQTYMTTKSNLFRDIICNLLLVQSWIPDVTIRYSLNGVTWFLSTYIFLSFISYFVIRLDEKFSKKYIYYLIFLNILSLFLAIFTVTNDRFWLYAFPPVRVIDFLCGFFLARIYENVQLSISKNFNNFIKQSFLEIGSLLLFLCCLIFHKIVPSRFTWQTVYIIPNLCLFSAFYRQKGFISLIFAKYKNLFLYLGRNTFFYFISHQMVIKYIAFFCNKFKFLNTWGVVISLIITLFIGDIFGRIQYDNSIKKRGDLCSRL